MTTYFDDVAFEQVTCCRCGIVFLIPAVYDKKKRNDHTDFSCPNGHSLSYKHETAAEKYKRLYEQEQQCCERANRRLKAEEDENVRLKMSALGHKSVAARLRKKLQPTVQ